MNAKSLVVAIFSLRCFNVVAVGRGIGETACAKMEFEESADLTSGNWTKNRMMKREGALLNATCACTSSTEGDGKDSTEEDDDEDDAENLTIMFPAFGEKKDLLVAARLPSPVVISKIPTTVGKALTSLEACKSVGLTLAVAVMWAIISGIIVWALVSNDPPLDIVVFDTLRFCSGMFA